ncbi:hypothetical protein AALO_G00274870 [Alosa alosa]|uniref:Uncharacterized protein n=1 Tax=Alosa alosa TaxID=278164 RepID=A0AAV6FKV4_9TELE|nr:hypothetical protein AALO_G00274870 [Alosa alosa]
MLLVGLLVLVAVCLTGTLGQLPDQNPPELAVKPGAKPLADSFHPGYGQDNHAGKDNDKLGVFIAAAVGTVALMGVVYCIYSQFYTKHPYLHTELQEDSDTLDLQEPYSPSVFPGCESRMEKGLGRGVERWRDRGRERGREGYGALSDTPSIITLPPTLSPPPSASSFASLSLSPPSPLKTISAQDLEKSFL